VKHPRAFYSLPTLFFSSGASPHVLWLSDFAGKSTLHHDPKVVVVLPFSNRLSPLLLDAIEHPEDLPESADLFCTPSASSPSQGTTRASPEIDLCAPSPEKARRNPNPHGEPLPDLFSFV
jgi:hypothetical protein